MKSEIQAMIKNIAKQTPEEVLTFCLHDLGLRDRSIAILFPWDLGITQYAIFGVDGSLLSTQTKREAMNLLRRKYEDGYFDNYLI